MSQYDFGTIDPYIVDGVQLADMLNQWRDAIHSWHRGAVRPTYVVPGMMWVNDAGGPANWIVNVYMGATVGDRPFLGYDTTTGAITILSSAGGVIAAGTLLAQAPANPLLRWNATANPIDQKDWRMTINATGLLTLMAYDDAGNPILPGYTFNPGGASSLVPPGVMWDYGGAVPPAGWYLCDGRLLTRAAELPLFNVIGTAFNIGGEAVTDFRIPDFRGRVAASPDSGGSNRLNTVIANSNVIGSAGGAQGAAVGLFELPGGLACFVSSGASFYEFTNTGGPWPGFQTSQLASTPNVQSTLIVPKIIKR